MDSKLAALVSRCTRLGALWNTDAQTGKRKSTTVLIGALADRIGGGMKQTRVLVSSVLGTWLGLLGLICIACAQAPQVDRTVVIAVSGDPGHLNPAISTAGPLHAVAGSIFNGLIALDAKGEPQPDLARSWTLAADGLSVSFDLMPEVRWHDGKPLTSEDIKFAFEEVLFKYHARARAGLAPVVVAIETPTVDRVVFRLKRPHPALLRQLDVTEAPIVPQHIYAGIDPLKNPANLSPIGTGPYRFDSYRKDDQVVVVRNEAYFKAGLPQLDRLVFRILPNASTQINALVAGEVDVLQRISAADAQRLPAGKVTLMDTRAGPGGANCIMTLAFNLERPKLTDLRVRQAFARAIDREQILKLVAFGQGRVAKAPIASGIAWAHRADALAQFERNPVVANELLDAAQLTRDSAGSRATFDLLLFPAFARYAEIMRQHLSEVGISLRVRPLDPAAFAQTVFSARDFDLALISYCNGTDPEIGVRRMYHSSTIGNVPFSNAAAYRSAEIDRLFDLAGAAYDQDARGRHYREIQRQLARDLPYWWLIETDFTAAWKSEFSGFEPWSGQFAERAKRSP